MRFTRSVFAVVAACAFVGGTAFADEFIVSDAGQHPDGGAAQKAKSHSGDLFDHDAKTDGDWYEPCAWELYPRDARGFKVGGWVQMGYHTEGANGVGVGGSWNFPNAFSKVNPFNNYPNVVQLQQAWVFAEKVADNGGCGWDWGFRVDYVYGTDGQDVQAYGSEPGNWDTTWDAGGFYGHALPQAYAEVAYNNVKVKVGKFFKYVSYENVQAPENFFYSHSMSFIFGPYTHTGIVAEWSPGPNFTLVGGWTAGWDTGFERNGGDMFLGGFSVQLTDDVSLTYMAMGGDFGFAVPGPGSDSDGYFHSVILDWQITDRWDYVLESNYLDNNTVAPYGPLMGVNQYLFYTLNCRWALGGRFEWLQGSGSNEQQAAFTVGANYRPHPNVVIRPEVRVDDFDPATGPRDSTLFGIDAILTF